MKTSDLQTQTLKNKWVARRKDMMPKVISVSPEELVESGFLVEGQELPLVIRPVRKEVDLGAWAQGHREFIEENLLKYGGLLFRGFGLGAQTHFEQFIEAISLPLMEYMEGATPRKKLGANVYTSTEFPPERSISIHNELCYVLTWPMKILFFCVTPPARGGETPIGDVRKVWRRLRPETRERFAAKGWLLLRNFGDGFGLPWQTSYHVSDRAALEDYFRGARISYEWIDDDHLRTRQVRPAVTTHPKTGETVWFNHIGFWHESSLEPHIRQMFLSEWKEEGLPFNTYYGDGSRIEESVIDELRRAYDDETIAFTWERGDILLLDNMLVAHGRNPFEGERRILTAMGEPYTRQDF
jgi:alpha-ketoglutarate-dependent taurine dioxygenase